MKGPADRTVALEVEIARHHAPLPAFVVVPADAIAAWKLAGTTTVEAELAGVALLYLTWIGRLGGAEPAMFRRAKLRLDAVPAAVLADALRSGALVGTLDLTAADGMPVCASVRPPAIVWTAG